MSIENSEAVPSAITSAVCFDVDVPGF